MWLFWLPDVEKNWSHSEQPKGLSPVWTLICCFRLLDLVNALVHSEHLNGKSTFSLVWLLQWVLNLPSVANDLEHSTHLCNFSSVCTIKCCLRWSFLTNDLMHQEQLNNFPPVWTLQMSFGLSDESYDFGQWKLSICFFLEWTGKRLLKWSFLRKLLVHKEQLKHLLLLFVHTVASPWQHIHFLRVWLPLPSQFWTSFK